MLDKPKWKMNQIKSNSSNTISGCHYFYSRGRRYCFVGIVLSLVVVLFLFMISLSNTRINNTWKKGLFTQKQLTTMSTFKNVTKETTTKNSSAKQQALLNTDMSSTVVVSNYQKRFYNSSRNSSTNSGNLFPSVQAFAIESSISTASTTSGKMKKVYRILAYGDSLTAGTSGYEYYPYAVYLERALLQSSKLVGSNIEVVVRHRGIPGMTVQQMNDYMNDERRGLRPVLEGTINPTLAIVIIMAGTNDIGYVLMKHNNNIELASNEIFQNIITLHTTCYETNSIPYTIAIGIPSSGYQTHNEIARQLVTSINEQLQQYSRKTSTSLSTIDAIQGGGKMIYMEFPFPYTPNDEKWHSDTLHFTQIGYQTLGLSLVPIVEDIIQSIDGDDATKRNRKY